MKLLQVLAKEMDVWPKGFKDVGQAHKGNLHLPGIGDHVRHTKESYTKASDWAGAIVTRAQWQAECDRQKGGEWKRHRGGKQPVDNDVYVEVHLRCGDIQQSHAQDFIWPHKECDRDANLTKYRVIRQPQAEQVEVNVRAGIEANVEYSFGAPDADMSKLDWKPLGKCKISDIEFDSAETEEAIMKRPFVAVPAGEPVTEIEWEIQFPSGVLNLKAKTDQIEGPLAWRDTIIHCQAIIEDYEREIQRNVDLLDAEGLMMQTDSKKAMQHYDALQVEPKDWQIGDILEITKHSDANSHEFKIGEHVKVDFFDLYDEDLPVRCYALDDSDYWYIKYDEAKFVRRP